jgi:peroxiredoxin
MVLGKRNIRLLIMLAGVGMLLVFGAFFFVPGTSTCPGHQQSEQAEQRSPAPKPARSKVDRTLLDERGEPIAPEEIAPGRKVAIVVMKGTWCPVCRAEVARLKARAHEVWGAGAVVAVVTDHAPEHNAAYADEHATPWAVLSDHDYDQLTEWGLYRPGMKHPVPGVVFLDRDGKITKIHRGRYPGRDQDDMIIETLVRD